MKNIIKLGYLLFVLFFFSCKKDNPDSPEQKNEVTLSGEIKESMTLQSNIHYLLKGKVFVKNNAVVTIPAGTIISAEYNADISGKTALVITQGSKLVINGTDSAPVIFTSSAGDKKPGDWIGIIVLGNAPTNLGTGYAMGLPETADTKFGGTLADDNSGSLKYLRIEYAGGLNPVNEEEWQRDMVSGLSLNAVGAGTQLDHVIVSNCKDDGYQFAGGTVNAKYLISYNCGDDGFDFDRGYTGKLQFIISFQSTASPYAIRANGMESLNDKDASEAQPYTRPVISNMTILGPPAVNLDLSNQSQGIYIRKNTRFNIRNSVIAGYSNGGLMLCIRTKPLLINNQGSEFKYNLVNCDNVDRAFTFDSDGSGINIIADPQVAGYAVLTGGPDLKPSVNNNQIINSIAGFQIKNPNSLIADDLSPVSTSLLLSGADFSDDQFSAFFSKVNFRGAIGTENWAAASWTNWK
jgi:hypothetical protein